MFREGEIIINSEQPALSLYGDRTHLCPQFTGICLLAWIKDCQGYIRRSGCTIAQPSSAFAVHREMLTRLHEDHHRYIRRMGCTFPKWTNLQLKTADRMAKSAVKPALHVHMEMLTYMDEKSTSIRRQLVYTVEDRFAAYFCIRPSLL